MCVRLASEDEALAVISEPETVKRLGKTPEHMTVQPWIIEASDFKMVFVFWLVGNGVYEAHIAMPKADIKASRYLCFYMLKWLFTQAGAKKVITNCPSGKIANLAKKLGMKQYKKEGNTLHFEVTPWELKPQLLGAP